MKNGLYKLVCASNIYFIPCYTYMRSMRYGTIHLQGFFIVLRVKGKVPHGSMFEHPHAELLDCEQLLFTTRNLCSLIMPDKS